MFPPANISAIALDLGTTSIKAGLLDQHGELVQIMVRHAPKIDEEGGHYESDALAFVETAEQLLYECVALAGDCKTLGLCSQRSSFLVWDQSTDQTLTPLISWQDVRGAASCTALRMHGSVIRNISGLPLTQYYFAAKLRVVLQENPEWLPRLERGELRVGTLDSFLIWRLTGGRCFITDASMAARTQLMDIRQQQWSSTLAELFGIPSHILAEIKPSVGMNIQLENGLILQSSVGDQSAALIASIRVHRPEALVNLGTGCFVIRYLTGGETASNGYLQTLVYQDSQQHAHFATEGTLNSIAAALAPYPVGVCSVDDLAVDDIYCVAEPSGMGAPYFRGDIGIRYSEPVAHLTQQRIAALLLEAVIFRVARILEEFDHECVIERVFLSGGLSELICLQRGIAACVPFEVHHLPQSESSLQGAALLAADIGSASRQNSAIIPATENVALRNKYLGWKLWLDDFLLGTS